MPVAMHKHRYPVAANERGMLLAHFAGEFAPDDSLSCTPEQSAVEAFPQLAAYSLTVTGGPPEVTNRGLGLDPVVPFFATHEASINFAQHELTRLDPCSVLGPQVPRQWEFRWSAQVTPEQVLDFTAELLLDLSPRSHLVLHDTRAQLEHTRGRTDLGPWLVLSWWVTPRKVKHFAEALLSGGRQ